MTSTLIANTQPKIISDSDCRIKLVGLGRNEISHHLENFGIEKQKLKNSGNPIFSKLRSEYDKGDAIEEEGGVSFEQDDTDRFQDLLEEVNETTTPTVISGPVIMDDEGEEVDFDDI